jgi:molybdopterin synthase sulfur carrier subunit
MQAIVRLPSALWAHSGGKAVVPVKVESASPVTVAALLDALSRSHPAVERRIRNERGELRRHVNLFLGAEDVRHHGGLDARVGDGDEVLVLAAISGGSC